MTNRLYYDQTYLQEFDAVVVSCTEQENGDALVVLDQSAFYPTSGGQPFDTGTIECKGQSYPVFDVMVDSNGEVVHRIAAGLEAGDHIHGRIDWERRFDHMQQHGGEHMLAGVIWNQFQGMTIGLHLGKENSTIDVTFPDGRTRLDAKQIALIEDQVNRYIHENLPIRCWFPDPSELKTLPLRKAPTVQEHVRIVAMGDFEMVACGGTHPASTGQIGSIRILSVTPERGKARFCFVCGMRAVHANRANGRILDELSALLSSPAVELQHAVEQMKTRQAETLIELKNLRIEMFTQRIDENSNDGTTVLWMDDGDPQALSEAVRQTIRKPGRTVLTGTRGRLIFACSQDVKQNMGQLIRQVGKGGGRKDFATGAGNEEALKKAGELLGM